MYAQSERAVPMTATKTAEKPRLQMQLDQLEKVLDAGHSCAGRIQNAADRLTGPKPQDVSKSPETAPPSNVEQRLARLIGVAEGLASRLNDAAIHLDMAA